VTQPAVNQASPSAAASNVRDLVQVLLSNLRSAFDWAWLDVVCQYRRSRIGPFWEAINVAVLVGGLSVVTTGIFGGSIADKIGYIGLGLIVWSAISSLVMEGCSTFVRHSGQIHMTNIALDLYVGRTVFKTLITFSHQLALYLVGVALGFVAFGWASLLALPGLVLLLLNGYWIATGMGLLCARFRDLEPIIRNLLQLLFLVTPIFWHHDQLSGRYRFFLVDYNPLYHFIALIRMPLLGDIPPAQSYLVAVATTIAGYIFAYVVYRRMRRQLAFFV
jgi:ABC-type polysaccharide/polyol phosphate export permease